MSASRLGAVLRQVDGLLREGTLCGLSDRELIERFRERGERSESAFAGLVERHGPMVLGVCRSVLRDPGDVEDAFQATFLVLVRRAGMLWVRDSIGPWLYNVAGRVALRARAEASRRRDREDRSAARDLALDDGDGGAEACERTEAARMVHEELARLPDRWRAPIVLCHLEGLTHEQASRSLGVPVGTVRSRLSRGRERLKDRLIRRGLSPSLAGLGAMGGGLFGEGSAAAIPASLIHKTVSAGIGLASGWTKAGAISVATYKLTQGVLMSMFLTNAKTAAMALLIGSGMLVTSMSAAGFGGANSIGASENVGSEALAGRDETPSASAPSVNPSQASQPVSTPPKPIQTTVRITVREDDGTNAFGSGTVISSTPQESIILTAGQLFLTVNRTDTKPSEFPYQVKVELIEQLPFKTDSGGHRFDVKEFAGKVIDYDWDRDMGLIRIHPGRALPFSPVVPPSWKLSEGMHCRVAGCTVGYSPTVGEAKILNPQIEDSFGEFSSEGIPGTHHNEGRTGGGLFTDDGHLAGVCRPAGPSDNRGKFALPASIHRFLDRNGLKGAYTAAPGSSSSPSQMNPPARTTSLSPAHAKPIQSTVRIRVGDKLTNHGWDTGVVISSTPEESIILTTGEVLSHPPGSLPKPREYPNKVQVEMIEELPLKPENAAYRSKVVSFPGKVIDYELGCNLGLIRIYPGRVLPFSPLVERRWKAKVGMDMGATGYPEGESPMSWATKVIGLRTDLFGFQQIVASGSSRTDAGAGGIFTDDGSLVGVGLSMEPNTRNRIYAVPASIYQILDRNGLKSLYAAKTVEGEKKEELTSPGAIDRTPRDQTADIAPKPGELQDIPKDEPEYLPPRSPATPPKPWETVVRIRIPGPESVAFASGTVISSTPDESIVLTVGRVFKLADTPQPKPANFPRKILVDLFDGNLQGSKPAKAGKFVETISGEIIDFDLKSELGLLRIRPGRQIPASPVVPSRWNPEARMNMLTVGCSEGRDPTVWPTKVETPRLRGLSGEHVYDAIECTMAPMQGRSGGGLFTDDSYLAGVCVAAESKGNHGYYIHPATIYAFLDRNELKGLYAAKSVQGGKAETASSGAIDRDPHIETAETEPRPRDPKFIMPPREVVQKPQAQAVPASPARPPIKPRVTPVAGGSAGPREAGPSQPVRSTVRITVRNAPGSIIHGSGTVVFSSPEEAVILTAGNLFRTVEKVMAMKGIMTGAGRPGSSVQARFDPFALVTERSPKPADFEGKINVEFFAWDSEPNAADPFEVTGTPGVLIESDQARDVALVRIKPGRVLPTSPIVPPTWKAAKEMRVMAVTALNKRKLPTLDATHVIDPSRLLGGNSQYEGIECRVVPDHEISGGGLFTEDGHLVGIGNYFDEAKPSFVYAASGSIHRILLRNGLDRLLAPSSEGERDLGIVIEMAEKQMSAKDFIHARSSRMLEDILGQLHSREKQIDLEKERVQYMTHRVGRLILEQEEREKARDSAQTPAKPAAADRSNPPPPAEPTPTRTPNPGEVEGRLKDVEQKLDRVLRLLEEKAQGPAGPAHSPFELPPLVPRP